MTDSAKRPANLPAGYDEEDPYEDEDLETYPAWWRDNIKEFQEHNMRPYRPPRFTDGELVPEVVNKLNRRLDATIRIQNTQPEQTADDAGEQSTWHVVVDDEAIATVSRHRVPEGYTLYNIDSDSFKQLFVTEGDCI